ncbi:MAG: hypothetical protein HYU97_06165 [Deltaproteobacteria bacterium]|nr:hypothetical protein [Deltaproteobacteria bacterium]
MPPKKKTETENPLTLSQLEKFYQKVIRPANLEQFSEYYQKVIRPANVEQFGEYYQKVIRPGNLIQFEEYYHKVIKPDIHGIIKKEVGDLRQEMNEHFEDLYKKFEDLRQEYLFANEQLKRIEKNYVTKGELQGEITTLKQDVLNLYSRLEQLERNATH